MIVVLSRHRPEAEDAVAALHAAAPDGEVGLTSHGGLLQVYSDDRPIIAATGPLLVQVPGEPERLLGTRVDTPVWWSEVHELESSPVADHFAEALAARTGGVVVSGHPVTHLSTWLVERIRAAEFAPAPGTRVTLPVADAFAMRTTGSTDCPGHLVLDVTVHHPALMSTELGALAEDVVSGLTSGAMLGWGTAEPVTQRWNRERLTEFCRDLAPRQVTLVVVGEGAVGMLAVERVADGLVERLRIGAGFDVPELAAVERLVGRLRSYHDVRAVTVDWWPGRADGTVSSS